MDTIRRPAAIGRWLWLGAALPVVLLSAACAQNKSETPLLTQGQTKGAVSSKEAGDLAA